MTYGTTPLFLEYFGLRGLEDLPAADELRRIPVETRPAGLTAEPGLATVPPDQLALENPKAEDQTGQKPENEAEPETSGEGKSDAPPAA